MPLEVDVEGEPVAFTAVERVEGAGSNVWFRVTADQPVGRGAVRTLFDGAGLKISRVMLVNWGPVALPRDLPRGRSRDLVGPVLEALLALAGRVEPERRPPRGPKPARARAVRRPTARRSGGR
jgi:23S rRNA pseudouridine2605 synthase